MKITVKKFSEALIGTYTYTKMEVNRNILFFNHTRKHSDILGVYHIVFGSPRRTFKLFV